MKSSHLSQTCILLSPFCGKGRRNQRNAGICCHRVSLSCTNWVHKAFIVCERQTNFPDSIKTKGAMYVTRPCLPIKILSCKIPSKLYIKKLWGNEKAQGRISLAFCAWTKASQPAQLPTYCQEGRDTHWHQSTQLAIGTAVASGRPGEHCLHSAMYCQDETGLHPHQPAQPWF